MTSLSQPAVHRENGFYDPVLSSGFPILSLRIPTRLEHPVTTYWTDPILCDVAEDYVEYLLFEDQVIYMNFFD